MEQFWLTCKEFYTKLSLLAPPSDGDISFWLHGYMAGVLVLSLLLLCCMLLWLIISFRRSLKGITLPAANGMIFISSRSISELVKSLDSDFTGIVIRRVSLVRRKKQLVIELSVIYQVTPASENAQKIIEGLQAKILATLNSVFGISNIAKVNVNLYRSKAVKSAF